MRLLLVQSGADFSVADVFTGVHEGLTALGHEVHPYLLGPRLSVAVEWLSFVLKRARKNDPSLPEKAGMQDVTLKASEDVVIQALRRQVDAVIFVSALFIHTEALVLCRRAGIRTGIVLTESPYQDAEQAGFAALAGVAWTNERSSVPGLRRANPETYYLPAAYSPMRHRPRSPDPTIPAHDVVFVGTMFPERVELLSRVDWTGIDLGLYGNWRALPSRHKLRRYVRADVVENTYAAELYRRAKIGLNLYRTCVWADGKENVYTAESLNPRAYELAACGVFQLSQDRRELADVFGESVPAFVEPWELEEIARSMLPHDAIRADMAAEARRRVAPHTFVARCARMVADLQAIGDINDGSNAGAARGHHPVAQGHPGGLGKMALVPSP